MRCIPDCPGGGNPDGPLGRHMSTVRTAALPPEHGSRAIGLGGAFKKRQENCIRHNPHINTVSGHTSHIPKSMKLLKFVKAEIYTSTGLHHLTD